MRRAVLIFLRSMGPSHPNTRTVLRNYTSLLQAMGRSPAQIRGTLAELGRRHGVDLGGVGGGVGNSPSPKLRATLEEILRDQSKLQEIAARLQREDPALLTELVQWMQSQQKEAE
jgi:hypothetical protein